VTDLVTGGSGFVGRRLVERLVREGRRVRCLVRSAAKAIEIGRLGVETVAGDVATGEGLEEAARGAAAVYHVAGAVRAWTRDAYFRVNALGTERVVAAARAAGARRLLLVSSLAAVGPAGAGEEVTEATPPRPITAYGESKLAGEEALRAGAGDVSWVIIRPPVVYGPGDRDVLPLFRLARRGLVPYAAPRGARIGLIHADDLAALVIAAMDRAAPGSVYMASDGRARSWPEIITAVAAAVGRPARAVRIAPWLLWPAACAAEALRPFTARPPILSLDKLREARQRSWAVSAARARADLGWSAAIPLEEGARLTAEWYRKEGWL
jgi:nucleoside-diphosphate-sugar epimerase